MGYLIVPDIHRESVVCQDPGCGHSDCKAMRLEWSHAECKDCGRPLKAGDPFYYVGRQHQCVNCAFREAEEKIEKQR